MWINKAIMRGIVEKLSLRYHYGMTDTIKLRNKSIVLVEDDKFLGGMVSKKLLDAGARVTLVEKGEEAVPVITQVKPDIILLDLLLPGMSGFDILKIIHADENLKHIPVVILSNLSEEKDIVQAKGLGVTDFLIKATIDMNEIVDHVVRNIP